MTRIVQSSATIVCCVVAFCSNINATRINVAVDIQVRTQYGNCQKIADRIVELVHAYVNASNDDEREHLAKKVKHKKKKLKRCEKDNKKWHKTLVLAASGAQASISHRF